MVKDLYTQWSSPGIGFGPLASSLTFMLMTYHLLWIAKLPCSQMIRRIQSITDFMQFQKDINNLVTWLIKWELKFNVSKCYILHLGPSHSYGDYYLDGNKIATINTVRDLGITIDSCLKFHDHTGLTITKANHILVLISKIFQYREL